MPELKARIQSWRQFLLHDMWVLDASELTRMRRRGVWLLRVSFVVVRGFIRDRCTVEASALTYITLTSLIPCLALLFAIAKSIGYGDTLHAMVLSSRDRLPEDLGELLMTLVELVNNTNFAALGIIGGAMVIWVAVRTIIRVEVTLNNIWGVQQGRSVVRRLIDYTALLLIVPPLLVTVATTNTFLSSNRFLQSAMEEIGALVIVYQLGWRILAFVIVAGVFTLLYRFLPHAKVRARPAIVGGLIAAALWILFQWACLHLQSIIFRSHPIYGAFAVLPVFLLWLWLNWSILLFGAEVSFAVQNPETYILELNSDRTSFNTRRQLAFLMTHEICRDHADGKGPWYATPYQKQFHLPIRLLRQVLYQLEDAGIIQEDDELGYSPARDLHDITLADIEEAMQGDADSRVNRALQSVSALAGLVDRPEEVYLEHLREITMYEFVHGAADDKLETLRKNLGDSALARRMQDADSPETEAADASDSANAQAKAE